MKEENWKYKATFEVFKMPPQRLFLGERQFVSMPVWKFLKSFKFRAAWFSIWFNWKFRKQIDWNY